MRAEHVHRILEGLRGEAFMVACDLGLDKLTQENGIRDLMDAIKKVVFPRASEEARELFRVGQRPNGPLSRQFGAALGSYISRRRQWWSTLRELDPSIQLSESMLTELLLEGAVTQQEILVIRACAGTNRSFERVASILVEHYSGVTMKDSHTLSAQSNPANQPYRPRTGKGQGYSSGSGKGRTGYSAAIAEDEEEWLPLKETMDGEDDDEDGQGDHYELEFEEAEALNALEYVDPENPESGEAIQLQLAANAAFTRTKGKGKPKGKDFKGKGKVV